MKSNLFTTASAGALLAVGIASAAQAEDLTLCWAAWDPANALIELSKDFEAESGHNDELRVRAVAKLCRPDAERAELGRAIVRPDDRRQPVDRRRCRKRPLRQAERLFRCKRHHDGRLHSGDGHRLRRMAQEHTELLRPAGLSETWSAGPTARTGSNALNCRQNFQRNTASDLGIPATLEELKDIAEFFQGRDIDGTTVYGAAIYTERGSEGITMGVTNALYNYGLPRTRTPKRLMIWMGS